MATGDLRGRFDVAYSMENGLGTEKDPETWRQPAAFWRWPSLTHLDLARTAPTSSIRRS